MKFPLAIALLVSVQLAHAAHAEPAGWEKLSPVTDCTARHEAALTVANGKIYLLGGRGLKPVEEFNPATNAWRKLKPTPIVMHHFQALTVGARILVAGAMTGGYPKEPSVPELWWFDPEKDEWTKGVALPAGRVRGGAGVALLDDKLYLIGGNTTGHFNGFVAWGDVLDLKTGLWTALPDAPHARDHFQAAAVDGKIVAAGGRATFAQNGHPFDLTVPEVDVFDPATAKWTVLTAKIPTPRGGCYVVVREGRVIVLGGESGRQSTAHNEVEALSLQDGGKWTALPSLLQGRHGTGAAFIGNDLYVAAGRGGRGGGPELNTIEKLRWIPLDPTP